MGKTDARKESKKRLKAEKKKHAARQREISEATGLPLGSRHSAGMPECVRRMKGVAGAMITALADYAGNASMAGNPATVDSLTLPCYQVEGKFINEPCARYLYYLILVNCFNRGVDTKINVALIKNRAGTFMTTPANGIPVVDEVEDEDDDDDDQSECHLDAVGDNEQPVLDAESDSEDEDADEDAGEDEDKDEDEDETFGSTYRHGKHCLGKGVVCDHVETARRGYKVAVIQGEDKYTNHHVYVDLDSAPASINFYPPIPVTLAGALLNTRAADGIDWTEMPTYPLFPAVGGLVWRATEPSRGPGSFSFV